MIGCGCLAKTMLELWKLEKIVIDKIIAIDPVECELWVKEMYPQMEYKCMALTKKNLVATLKPLLESKPFVFDLSVDVDCIPIIKLCRDMGCIYLNSSIESWGDKTPWILNTTDKGLYDRSLYKRQMEVEKLLGTKKSSTILTNHAQNPGMVSSYVKRGLIDYAKKHGSQEDKQLAKGLDSGKIKQTEFCKLAKSLGLEEVHISEIDTQKFDPKFSKKLEHEFWFYSTWSPTGFWAESLDPVQMGWGSNRDPKEGYKPTVGEGNVRIFPTRGMDAKCKSVTLGLKGEQIPVNGMLIPHAEADTISSFLTDGAYSPSVFYVYQPSSLALESLDCLRKAKYHPPPPEKCYAMRNDDVLSGFDSVGTLLLFKDGKAHWTGSVVSVEFSRGLGFRHSNPTIVQVGAGVWGAMKWIENNHKRLGYLEPEDLDYKQILKYAMPYLGRFYSKTL